MCPGTNSRGFKGTSHFSGGMPGAYPFGSIERWPGLNGGGNGQGLQSWAGGSHQMGSGIGSPKGECMWEKERALLQPIHLALIHHFRKGRASQAAVFHGNCTRFWIKHTSGHISLTELLARKRSPGWVFQWRAALSTTHRQWAKRAIQAFVCWVFLALVLQYRFLQHCDLFI